MTSGTESLRYTEPHTANGAGDDGVDWSRWDAWVESHIASALAGYHEHLASHRAYVEQLVGEVVKGVYEDVAAGFDKLRAELETLRKESRRERKQEHDKVQIQLDAMAQRLAAIADRLAANSERISDIKALVGAMQEASR
jgi:hypothetical protein